MKYKLYGNGADDDFPAIQEMLDGGASRVTLPAPEKHYVIGNTLKIHSYQELKLGRFTRIVLKEGANCAMLENADFDKGNKNVCVNGGIWDMNHNKQSPNPYHFPSPDTGRKFDDEVKRLQFDKTTSKTLVRGCYTGMCFRFCTVKNLIFRNVTIVNPVVYGVQCAYTEDFSFDNIVFDYNEGSPKLWNMDGIHIEGGCKNGTFRNLKGACHDDLLAFTTDDSLYGPIFNMEVDGIFAEGCHSAVRMLSAGTPLKNIHIRDIYGSFYVYCICMTKYYEDKAERGNFDNIVIENVYARFCDGTKDVAGHWAPLIQIGKNVDIGSIDFANIHRDEDNFAAETIGIWENAAIGKMTVRSAKQTNATGKPMPFIKNEGRIGTLVLDGVDAGGDCLLAGSGAVKNRAER
ncbi:MAG: hypothetical protein DBX59_01990 [Bacillota bacterium]|nr:MAG: hypothetical protein DBX59_01990 [Bacillota bacterium]